MTAFLRTWDELSQNKHVKKVIGSNTVALYSAMSLIYFAAQLLVLISASDANISSTNLIRSILDQGHISITEYAYLESGKNGSQLRICPDGISQAANLQDCPVVFPVENLHGSVATTAKRGEEYTMVPVFSGDNLTAFMMVEDSLTGEVISLPPVCVRALEWPYQTLLETRREDITAACFQAWLFVMSIIAIFGSSLSHVGAALVAHILAFVWSSTKIAGTVNFRADYHQLITSANGACDGFDLIGTYFKHRLGYEIAAMIVNFVTMLMSAYLAWRLVSIYGGVLFQNMDISPVIKKAYIVAIVLGALIQLEAFFHVTSFALWLDEITKQILGAKTTNVAMYLGLYIPLALLVVPWLCLVWYGIRRECKKLMITFFALLALQVAGFAGMFASSTFRQTLLRWPFFSAMFIISYVLILAVVILAVICQTNFGIGLPDYLATSTCDNESSPSFDNKVDMEKANQAVPEQFVLSSPPKKTPKRQLSNASTSSTFYSERSLGYSKGKDGITAAQPGSINISPPNPAVGSATFESPKSSQKVIRFYGKELWGRSKRHESAMSFGHMDASKLDANPVPYSKTSPRSPSGFGAPFHVETPSFSRTGTLIAPPSRAQVAGPRAQKVDSMGSIYSTQSGKPQLFLVTNLL